KAASAGSQGVDDPGHLVADRDRWRWSVGVEADASEDVGEIQSGGADADADLPRPRNGFGGLLDLQDLGTAVSRDDQFSHRRPPTPWFLVEQGGTAGTPAKGF